MRTRNFSPSETAWNIVSLRLSQGGCAIMAFELFLAGVLAVLGAIYCCPEKKAMVLAIVGVMMAICTVTMVSCGKDIKKYSDRIAAAGKKTEKKAKDLIDRVVGSKIISFDAFLIVGLATFAAQKVTGNITTVNEDLGNFLKAFPTEMLVFMSYKPTKEMLQKGHRAYKAWKAKRKAVNVKKP